MLAKHLTIWRSRIDRATARGCFLFCDKTALNDDNRDLHSEAMTLQPDVVPKDGPPDDNGNAYYGSDFFWLEMDFVSAVDLDLRLER